MLSECNPRCAGKTLWGPRHVVVMGRPLQDKVEIRGYDGTQGDWVVLLLDVPEGTKSFCWSEDLARTWTATVPITGDWQPLRDGIEVRFNEHDWEKGYTVHFSLRGQLVTAIEKIEGKVVTLRDAPTRTVSAATLRHCDDAALQAAIDRAIQEKRNLHVPVGRYRLSRGLSVRNATAITIEGANPVDTVLDISEGEGGCITLSKGIEVTVRNFTMVGHSGFAERDQCGHPAHARLELLLGVRRQRVQRGVDRQHRARTDRELPRPAHGDGVFRVRQQQPRHGGQTERGALQADHVPALFGHRLRPQRLQRRDVRLGEHERARLPDRRRGGLRVGGRIALRQVRRQLRAQRGHGGDGQPRPGQSRRDLSRAGRRAAHHRRQRVREQRALRRLRDPCRGRGATQVLVTNNLFVNFGSSAVHISGNSDLTHYPSANATIAGNLFDMTEVRQQATPRTAVEVSAPDVIVSDNQIYVRGACDPLVTAIKVLEPAVNVGIHDNLIRNCGVGILTGRASSRVGEVIDGRTFALGTRTVPLDHRAASQCQGWGLVWLAGGRPTALSAVEAITGATATETVKVALKEPHAFKSGDSFELIPSAANWRFQGNTVTDCQRPIVLDSYGGPSSIVRANTVTRGSTADVKQAFELHGRFTLIGNHTVGFDDEGSAALRLFPDPLGRTVRGLVHDNIFERCAHVVSESQKGLWDATSAGAMCSSTAAPRRRAPRPRSRVTP